MDHFLDDATSLDPAFPSRIEGASPDEVDRVQAAANVPLPADYRKYLDLMGRNDAGMITAPEELSTSASEIAAFYETDREQDEYVVPDGCLVAIAVGCGPSVVEPGLDRLPQRRRAPADLDAARQRRRRTERLPRAPDARQRGAELPAADDVGGGGEPRLLTHGAAAQLREPRT